MEKYVRKLQKGGSYSYAINIPKELVDEFSWREGQKLEITFGGRKPNIEIKDWEPKRKNNQEEG